VKIGLIGQGGHSKVIEDIIIANKKYKIIGYFDDKFTTDHFKHGVYNGPIDTIKQFISEHEEMKLIIAIGNNLIRKSILERLMLSKDKFVTAIHPSAIISPSAKIGKGTVVMPYAVINANAEVGDHTIINTCSVIEHDNLIESFVHISPNVTLTGGVQVKEGAHIGASATVIPNKKVGEWSIIGAGATVIHDIPENCTAIGTPARINKVGLIGGAIN